MTNPDPLLVLVGRRRGAIRAARRLGLQHRVIDPPDATPDDDVLRGRVAAVVALTEAAVVPAARLRERLGLAGLSSAAARRCTDKLEMKRTIRAAGIACARFIPVHGAVDAADLIARLGLPLVLKTQAGSGGRGTRVIRSRDELPASVSQPSLAEAFVEGVEMSVESMVLGGVPVFVNFTEYVEPAWANLVPAAPGAQTAEALLELNRRAIAALGIRRGMTHMEVFLTGEGAVFGELAARPPGGHIMRLIDLAYGFDPWAALLTLETGQRFVFPPEATRTAGMRFFHPGPGVVRATHGLDVVCALSSVESVVARLSPGDVVGPRDGTGQHRGYALFTGDAARVREDLETTRASLWVEMEAADRNP